MNKKFYLTTAIAYTSSKPHIGNVYEAILADAIVRFKRKQNYDVYFQTGTDEHGQKIENQALSNNITPQEHVDQISDLIKGIYSSVDVKYDYFVRTTDESHKKIVQAVFKKLYDQGDIYKGEYEGHYCVDCESYYTTKDLVDNNCPDCGAAVNLTKEEAYFFKISKYQDRLIKHINENPRFIQPQARKNEMLNNFLNDTLPDLCVSRTSYTWGIPVSFDSKHVVYVWIDALMNYITALGYDPTGNHQELFNKYWPANIHLIGKDILRFHTIYWPIILMALGLELPKEIFAHPWILMNHRKMSKSKNHVIFTDELVDVFGVDTVRYYVLREIPYISDGNLTFELVCEKHNSDLANTLGNLVNRTMAMTKKYFNSKVTYHKEIFDDIDKELINLFDSTYQGTQDLMEVFKVGDTLELIMKLLRRLNKYIDEKEPWVLAKDSVNNNKLENVLFILLEGIRFSSILLESFIPRTSLNIYDQININDFGFESLTFGFKDEFNINEASVLFKRLDLNVDVLSKIEVTNEVTEIKEVVEEKIEEELIDYEDFIKVKLVVGKIVEATYHPNADKLLVFKVDIKEEIRTIVSGIAKFYDPSTLVGKKVVVCKNLKPRVIRKIESHGMLLCAADDEDNNLELLNIEKMNPGDLIN